MSDGQKAADEAVEPCDGRLLVPGQTCWRTAVAGQFAPVIDGAAAELLAEQARDRWQAARLLARGQGRTSVHVHAKVMVVDDRLLRIGSSNLNNRSLGFDSECDLALEASGIDRDDVRQHIIETRHGLVAEHLGVPLDTPQREVLRHNSFQHATNSLRGTGRSLRKFTAFMIAADASPLAENELMDPDQVPPSIGQSVWSLVGGVAAWPLERASSLWGSRRIPGEQPQTRTK